MIGNRPLSMFAVALTKKPSPMNDAIADLETVAPASAALRSRFSAAATLTALMPEAASGSRT
jgi:hypothetical protein